MTQGEKQRFYELAQKDAERYQAECVAFGGEDAMRKRKRAKKDPNAPKRALYVWRIKMFPSQTVQSPPNLFQVGFFLFLASKTSRRSARSSGMESWPSSSGTRSTMERSD